MNQKKSASILKKFLLFNLNSTGDFKVIDGLATRMIVEAETGYVGIVEKISADLFSSPGILSETVSFAHISVDEMLSENRQPVAKNEPGEFITVFLKYPEEISAFFNEEMEQNVQFDVKLYTYFMAQGLL